MKIENKTVLGIDVSKADICCHLLTSYPEPNPKDYWNRLSRKSKQNFPRFYSVAATKKNSKKRTVQDFYKYLEEHQPDFAVMEPTGVNYSRLWASILYKYGVKILWVAHAALSAHRDDCKFSSDTKSDAIDALALASYVFDKNNLLGNGEIDPRSYLIDQPENVLRLREFCLWHDHIDRVTTALSNYTRQRMAWQFPECAHSEGMGFFPFLADAPEFTTSRSFNIFARKYDRSVVHDLDITFDVMTRNQGRWICEMEAFDGEVVAEIEEMLMLPEFERYNHILDKFYFCAKTKARLISRIYPFETFLLPGNKLWKERRLTEVKHNRYRTVDGKKQLIYRAGDTKRTLRNLTRDKFKMRLGLGKKIEESGDKHKKKRKGSDFTRNALFLYVRRCIVNRNIPYEGYGKKLMDYSDELRGMTDNQGETLLKKDHATHKVMARLGHYLYWEFANEFVVRD